MNRPSRRWIAVLQLGVILVVATDRDILAAGGKGVGGPPPDMLFANGFETEPTLPPLCVQAIHLTINGRPGPLSFPMDVPLSVRLHAEFPDGSTATLDIGKEATVTSDNTSRIADPASDGYTYTRPEGEGGSTGLVTLTATVAESPDGRACPGGGELVAAQDVNVTAAALTSIAVTPANTSVAVDRSVAYTARGDYSDGSRHFITRRVNWQSPDEGIASVVNDPDSPLNGIATGEGPGEIPVIASHAKISGFTTLTVNDSILINLTARLYLSDTTAGTDCLSPLDSRSSTEIDASAVHPAGGYRTFMRAYGEFSDLSVRDVTTSTTFDSMDPNIATVSNAPGTHGLITTGSVAGSVILAATDPSSISDTIELIVTDDGLEAIEINRGSGEPDPAMVRVGDPLALGTHGRFGPSNWYCITPDVTYYSSNISLASAGNAGMISGVAAGNTTVTASRDSLSDEIDVVVTNATVDSIAVLPSSLVLEHFSVFQLKALATLSDASVVDVTSSVTWSATPLAVSAENPVGLFRTVEPGKSSTADACLDLVCASDSGGLASISVVASP